MPRYFVMLSVKVDADNIREAVELASDMASVPQENASVIGVNMVDSQTGAPKTVQWGRE